MKAIETVTFDVPHVAWLSENPAHHSECDLLQIQFDVRGKVYSIGVPECVANPIIGQRRSAQSVAAHEFLERTGITLTNDKWLDIELRRRYSGKKLERARKAASKVLAYCYWGSRYFDIAAMEKTIATQQCCVCCKRNGDELFVIFSENFDDPVCVGCEARYQWRLRHRALRDIARHQEDYKWIRESQKLLVQARRLLKSASDPKAPCSPNEVSSRRVTSPA